jgi:hypothetical protein
MVTMYRYEAWGGGDTLPPLYTKKLFDQIPYGTAKGTPNRSLVCYKFCCFLCLHPSTRAVIKAKIEFFPFATRIFILTFVWIISDAKHFFMDKFGFVCKYGLQCYMYTLTLSRTNILSCPCPVMLQLWCNSCGGILSLWTLGLPLVSI